MWFKNLTVYRLPADWSWSAAALEEALARRPLQPCSPLEMRSMGWVPPATTDRLLHTLGEHHLLALGVDQKLLPASIVRQEAERRARAQAENQGFQVGRRQMRALKMQVLDELRARALSRRRITRAWIDPRGGWLVVDSASDRRAEELIETLRDTLGSLAVQKVDTERAPSATMAAWLMQSDAAGPFSIEQDLELQSGEPAKSIVRYRRHPLDGKEIRAYVAGGKRPTQLGLTWNGRISFVLTEKLQIKRVEFLEVTRERGDEEEIDPAEQFDLDFAVMAGELAKLIIELLRELNGQQASGHAAAA
ncbi:MAG TPA: recombination-associated protein RdgC [Steroidobacteraceae bacterium]|jgi:recombination associated protein RdgC|nr:recombination-associated protein RdgC [Steroidobacteraceae bacterium]